MRFQFSTPFALALVLLGPLGMSSPSRASVPFTWAQINALENRVDLISASGTTRSATVQDQLRAGDTLNTDTSSQAELLFNDGSLARLGGDAIFRFWPTTRNLELTQGTALLFVPPEQGRAAIQTPNAVIGIHNNAMVVRYVPIYNLTLVMALASPETGPLALSLNTSDREYALFAGQMAFINDAGIQVVEFDLQEFYSTSNLVMGLHLADPAYMNRRNDPLTALRPQLLDALEQQQPFPGSSSVLDPQIISNTNPNQSLFGDDEALLVPSDSPHGSGSLGHYEEAPPGVVSPMPEPIDSEPVPEPTEPPPTEQPEPPQPDPNTVTTPADGGNNAPPANPGP